MSSDLDLDLESWHLCHSHHLTCSGRPHSEKVKKRRWTKKAKNEKKKVYKMAFCRVPPGGSVDQRDALQPRNSASKVPEQILAIKDLVDKRAKIRGRRLRYEQMRGSNQTLGSTKSTNFVSGSDKNESGHRYELEITRQERSQKDAEDDLKMRNIKSLLKKLLNKKGLGGYTQIIV